MLILNQTFQFNQSFHLWYRQQNLVEQKLCLDQFLTLLETPTCVKNGVK